MHNDTSYVAMIFLLDVFLTAYWTDGYLLGIIMAVVGVFSVDIIFTYPFWHISFTLTGFPLTFLVMMTISILTATVTSRAKQTEQVRREADREKMYADLLRAVSHDIRTPLTGIVGATNVLLEQDGGLTQEQRQQLLRSTNEDAQWLIRIVENLLSITRISSEEAKVKKEPEPAEEVIESAVAKTHKHYPEVDIRVHLPAELMMVPMDGEPDGERRHPRRDPPYRRDPVQRGQLRGVHCGGRRPRHSPAPAAPAVRRLRPQRPQQ